MHGRAGAAGTFGRSQSFGWANLDQENPEEAFYAEPTYQLLPMPSPGGSAGIFPKKDEAEAKLNKEAVREIWNIVDDGLREEQEGLQDEEDIRRKTVARIIDKLTTHKVEVGTIFISFL